MTQVGSTQMLTAVATAADDVRADVLDRNITPEAAVTRYGVGDSSPQSEVSA